MSSFAAARLPEEDPENFFANSDEQRALEASYGEAGANQLQTLDEVHRIERLLTQLEARSMALVPYSYGTLREVPTRRWGLIILASVLVAVWLTTLVLGMAYIRYLSHLPAPPERAARVRPLVIQSDPDPQEQKVVSSVDHLTKVLVSSSERLSELQAAMERSNRDLQRIATKMGYDLPTANTRAPRKAEALVSSAIDSGTFGEAYLPKNWHRVLEIKPTEAAHAHRAMDGTIDYWIVPRGAELSPNKVLPIGTSAYGVVVHDLDDGKDYTISPMGEWRSGLPVQPAGN